MHPLDMKFFDEYKRLDKFCKDMLCSSTGVTEYITIMENTDFSLRRHYCNFEDDYYLLKHLRHIRNLIAHESSSENQISDEEDYIDLEKFYDRILNCDDPLSKIKVENAKRAVSVRKRPISNTDYSNSPSKKEVRHTSNTDNYHKNPEKKSSGTSFIFKFSIIIILIVLTYLLLNNLD